MLNEGLAFVRLKPGWPTGKARQAWEGELPPGLEGRRMSGVRDDDDTSVWGHGREVSYLY